MIEIIENLTTIFPEIAKRSQDFPFSLPSDSDVYLLMQIQQNFEEEGRPEWKEFAKMPDPPRKLLDKTGAYKGSIEISRESDGIRLFTECEYAEYHEHLDKDYLRPPERKVFVIPDDNMNTFAEGCALFLVLDR